MSENLNSCKFFVINAPSASCLNLACRWEHCVANIKFIKSSMQKNKAFLACHCEQILKQFVWYMSLHAVF